MKDNARFISLSYTACALAEGLDYPTRELVILSPTNRLLSQLAHLDRFDAQWNKLTTWMNRSVPGERLHELRRSYYETFLRTGTEVSLYVHDWFSDRPPSQFLSEWQRFLCSFNLKRDPRWPNGSDHISVFLELLGLLAREEGEIEILVQDYFLSWFGDFTRRLDHVAQHLFYRTMAVLATEVRNAINHP